jgi:hypothetical protein
MPPTINTVIRVYHFDISKQEQAKDYQDLKRKLVGYPHRMHSSNMGNVGHYALVESLDGQTIQLETEHLFNNQWNTAPIAGVSDKGLRVFDWASDAGLRNKNIRQGHYLEQTDEMRELRRNTMCCNYCGKQEPAAKGNVFCPHCIGSEYLTEKDLFLTRMTPIDQDEFVKSLPALTEAEREHLLPLYKEAQLHGHTAHDKQRIAKLRADIAAEYTKITSDATTKRDGFTWLMDNGVKTDNVIFYSHTGIFCFGWRTPLNTERLSGILEIISEFHWPYEIKCADGRKLTGNID